LNPIPAFSDRDSHTYERDGAVRWASPPLVVVRLDTFRTLEHLKMMIMPISPISMATIKLDQFAEARFEGWGMDAWRLPRPG